MGVFKDLRRTIKFYTQTQRNYAKIAQGIQSKYYTSQQKAQNTKPQGILMMDGRAIHGGLADRLRACLSIFQMSKASVRELKINLVHPFKLSDYLVPNKYNWEISPDEVCYNDTESKVYKINSSGAWGAKKLLDKKLFKIFTNNYKQIHLYSNYVYSKDKYKQNFDLLFKPTDELANAINENKQKLGESYHSATFRFQELLGDFKEKEKLKTLGKKRQKRLINKCLKRLKKQITTLPKGYKMLVTSDSITFLEAAKSLDKVYVIPGIVVHPNHSSSKEKVFLKSFLDLYLLRDSQKVILFKTGKMYSSGFPDFAAKIGNNNFKIIRF